MILLDDWQQAWPILFIGSKLESEEEHVDWLETNLGLIDKIGLANYLQSQMGEFGPG